MSDDLTPKGELTIRTLAMPADTNPHGDIFGGWVLSQMDIAGGIYSRKETGQKTVTVAVDAMEFLVDKLKQSKSNEDFFRAMNK